jgi:hypothetical protein
LDLKRGGSERIVQVVQVEDRRGFYGNEEIKRRGFLAK